ncbi:hypothetical protein [Streptacidiphilus jiangxiensis]|uniref:Uncharacterized protein n=1 Tax=Streptacidiphilus jiangxiensis TaxID=235985 RepID=A0A1H7LWF5_STRJI|nr:hypothetical protein [Streptacidiphilus jiangxiensis]SEL03293.1 hypothetical protein SAMN05414137_10570 [Streptacidiphilus jiangxiensis]
MSKEEELLRRGLTAAASRAAAPPDLFDKVAGARTRARRNRTRLAVAGGTLAVAAVATVTAVATLGGSGTTQVTTAAAGLTASCPATPADPQHALFNAWRGPTRVDPAPRRVLVCSYVPHTTNPLTWRLAASTELTGPRAATVAGRFNSAPTADPRQRCLSAGHEELWFFMTGTSTTAEVRAQIGGCGYADDGTHAVSWRYPDPLTEGSAAS